MSHLKYRVYALDRSTRWFTLFINNIGATQAASMEMESNKTFLYIASREADTVTKPKTNLHYAGKSNEVKQTPRSCKKTSKTLEGHRESRGRQKDVPRHRTSE